MSKKIITVKPGGVIQFIDDDRLQGIVAQGEPAIGKSPRHRMSHVEPGDPDKGQDTLKWYASMVGGPVLGPFDKHAEAIAAEIEYINQHILTGAAA